VTRSIAILLVGLLLISLLVLVAEVATWPKPVRSASPLAWRPVPATLLSPWPDVPVDAGRPLESQAPLTQGLRTDGPSILPSAQPTGGLIPPFVAEKGIAGIGTYYAYHRGQAAAAASLRAFLGPDWRGMTVDVCVTQSDGSYKRCLRVQLTDYESSLIPGRLIDLDVNDWAALCGDPGKGICEVVVTHG
jgi:hypothetical protein